MHKITFTKKALNSLDAYTIKYRELFQSVYEDSPIWNNKKIASVYNSELTERYNSLLDTIFENVSNNIILFEENGAFLRWRTKILLVYFKDEGNTRIITDLEIR